MYQFVRALRYKDTSAFKEQFRSIDVLMIETPNKFALIIENMVKEKKISYIDAILEYCKDNEIDPSNTKSMINKNLKEKIAYEAQNLNMLKEKVAKLPL